MNPRVGNGEAPRTWRVVRDEIVARLARAALSTAEIEASFLVEHVSGYSVAEWPSIADEPVAERAYARVLSDPPRNAS